MNTGLRHGDKTGALATAPFLLDSRRQGISWRMESFFEDRGSQAYSSSTAMVLHGRSCLEDNGIRRFHNLLRPQWANITLSERAVRYFLSFFSWVFQKNLFLWPADPTALAQETKCFLGSDNTDLNLLPRRLGGDQKCCSLPLLFVGIHS